MSLPSLPRVVRISEDSSDETSGGDVLAPLPLRLDGFRRFSSFAPPPGGDGGGGSTPSSAGERKGPLNPLLPPPASSYSSLSYLSATISATLPARLCAASARVLEVLRVLKSRGGSFRTGRASVAFGVPRSASVAPVAASISTVLGADHPLSTVGLARVGKAKVAAGEVDDDPAKMRLKRGRAYVEMAMKWSFKAGRPTAYEDSDDELVADSDGTLRFKGSEGDDESSVVSAGHHHHHGGHHHGGSSKGGGGGVLGGPAGLILSSEGDRGGGGDHHHHHHSAKSELLKGASSRGFSQAAFRKLLRRAKKADAVPTREDLKRASVKAEARLRAMKEAKKREEERAREEW